jgi:hypothetical protein
LAITARFGTGAILSRQKLREAYVRGPRRVETAHLRARRGCAVSISASIVRLKGDHPRKEEAMKYMLLIHHGDSPTPDDPEAWAKVSEQERKAIYADYQALSSTPGVTPGLRLQGPEAATTVRVEDGKTLTTDGPFATTKEALGGWLFFEADDLDAAIELASTIPATRLGGGVEVRPIMEE